MLTKIIEQLGWDKDRGHIVFTLIDDLSWEDEELHIGALQQKLNACMASIERESVFRRLSLELGHEVPHHSPIKIVIRGRYPMSTEGEAFFNYAKKNFTDAKIGLFFKPAEPAPVTSPPGT